MAEHGYLRDYDEDRDQRRNNDRYDRDREFMFGGRERRDSPESNRFREEDWLSRETHRDEWRGQDRFGGNREEARRPERFSSHQDDHYRSWRQQQMEALDREYEDYCREREQQFHRDFDSWRSDRRNQGSSETEGTDTELELTEDRAISARGNMPSPVDQATLGTNDSENSKPGPGKTST